MAENPRRIAHNFLNNVFGGNYTPDNLEVFAKFYDFVKAQKEGEVKKVALLFICLNPHYWSLIKDTIETARKYFLPGHDVDFYIWSDIIKPDADWSPVEGQIKDIYYSPYSGQSVPDEFLKTLNTRAANTFNKAKESSAYVFSDPKIHIVPSEGRPWPAGTLYRFHMFLQMAQELKKYEYLFYSDIDMRFVNYIGDEILSDLVAAEHPMYSLKKQIVPPYEPNPQSKAFIKRPGTIVEENGVPRFKPFYYAGGFQGGKTQNYLEAAKWISEAIDWDENNLNYRAIWNDESYWNSYLFHEKSPSVVFSPSFIYPDSLIKEYYEPIWGTQYPPKIITLTKDWSLMQLSKEQMNNLNNNQQIK